MKWFNRTLIFDFGTSNTIVCEDGHIVFDEPTAIAYFSNGKIGIGNESRLFCSMYYDVVKPIVNGRVENYDAFEIYVHRVVKMLVRFPRLCLKTVVIAVPNDMNGDVGATAYEKAFFEPFCKMGINDIRAINRGVALSSWVLRN